MRLAEALRRNRDDDPLDERVAAELEAIDSALRGDPVEPEMSPLATLTDDLRCDREEIESDFSARLDAWAAAGFPRGERPGSSPSRGSAAGSSARGLFERARLRLASTPPRRIMAPAFAAASAIVIAAVVIGHSDQIGGGDQGVVGRGTVKSQGAAAAGAGDGDAVTRAPSTADDPSVDRSARFPRKAQSSGLGAYAGRSADAGADKHYLNPAAGDRGENLDRIRKNRKVERDAQLSLAAKAGDVPGVAARAADVTERYKGHVLSSQVSGSPRSARATLELAIPSKNLDPAISDLSDLAEVSSRSESSNDITRPFVSARDRLSGLRAERDSLVKRLAAASTDQETEDLKAKLSVVNSRIADARASVQRLKGRAEISHVTLQVSSESVIGGSDGGSGGGWGIGDALHDAGHVLTVAGGIALISGAVLLPLAVIALLVAMVLRSTRTRSRERALD